MCEADHRTPWAKGGTTSPGIGDPLCRKHNRYKSTAGYTTTIDHTTGITHVQTSNGRELVPVSLRLRFLEPQVASLIHTAVAKVQIYD